MDHLDDDIRFRLVELLHELASGGPPDDHLCNKLVACVGPALLEHLAGEDVLRDRVAEARRRHFHVAVAGSVHAEGEAFTDAIRRLLAASLRFAGIRPKQNGPGTTAIMRAVTDRLGARIDDTTIRSRLYNAVRLVVRGYQHHAFTIVSAPAEVVAAVERHAFLCLFNEDLYIGQLVRRARHFGLRQDRPSDNDDLVFAPYVTNFICHSFRAARFADPSHITPEVRLPEAYYS